MPPFDAHALVIGISRYQHVGRLLHKPDAEDLARTLVDPELCGYPQANVKVLLQEEATKARIVEELGALARRATAGSTVLVYFSGHGGMTGGTCYLVPVDGTKDTMRETCLSGPELSRLLAAIGASKVTTVLDCCHAAGTAEPGDAVIATDSAKITASSVAMLAQGVGRAVLAASNVEGASYATYESANGLFTGHLLAGLRGGVVGVGGVIRVCQLYDYAQRETVAQEPKQRPIFKAEFAEDYAVALYRGGARAPLTLPALEDGAQYDAFLSVAKADAEWARRHLVQPLEALGLKLCLEDRDFRLGAPRLKEMERAVLKSRYTICALTPDYLRGPFEEFQKELARFRAVESGALRFLPLLCKASELPLLDRMAQLLDVSDPKGLPAAIEQLAVNLRTPPGLADDGAAG